MDTFFQFVSSAVTSANFTYSRWVTEELLSIRWLTIIAILLLACILLVKLIDRSRLREIILFGSIFALLCGYTDVIATEYGLWEYKTHIIPLKSSMFPFSYTMPPMFHMLAYQYSNSWRRFAVLNTMVAAFFAFIAHPFYVWTDVLWLGNWNYLYSFLYLTSVPLGVRAIVMWITKLEQQPAAEAKTSLFPALQPAMKPTNDLKNKEKD